MIDYYQPTITLNGTPLAAGGPVEGLAVLSGLSMEWGATDWLGDTEPGKLTLTLLDPDGKLLRLVGSSGDDVIQVHRADGLVWSGWFEDATAELRKLPRAHGPGTRYVWEVTVTATDVLGKMNAHRKHGPGGYTGWHWGPSTQSARFADLADVAGVPIRTSHHLYTPDSDMLMAPYEKKANVSALTVLRRSCRASNTLSRPYMLYRDNEIVQLGIEAETVGIRLEAPGGVIDAAPVDPAVLTVLDGGDYSIDGRVRIEADPATRITRVERVGRKLTDNYPKLTYEDDTQQQSTGVKLTETATASFETDRNANFWNTTSDPSDWSRASFFAAIFQRLAPGTLNYRVRPTDAPTPGIRLEHLRPEPVIKHYPNPAAPAFGRWGHAHYYLLHSLTSLVPNAHGFAIVGGTLRYDADRGWTHQMRTAPTGDTIPASAVTLGDLTLTAEIGDAATGLRLADLERITTI